MLQDSLITNPFIPRVGNVLDTIFFLKLERKEYPWVMASCIVLMSAISECSQNDVDPEDYPLYPPVIGTPTPWILALSFVELSIPWSR